MPDIEPFSPRGMFHEGWTAEVNDYAIDVVGLLKVNNLLLVTWQEVFLHLKEILEKLFGKKKILTLVVY